MPIQTHLHVFLLWNIIEDVLKSVGNQIILGPTDLFDMFLSVLWKSMGAKTVLLVI